MQRVRTFETLSPKWNVFITPLSIKLGYMKKRKNKDSRSQRWLTILRKRHFPDRVDAYALAEIVKECTRPVQARARQDPSREEGA